MKTPTYGLTSDLLGFGYSSDPSFGAEPGYRRSRRIRVGDPAYRPSFVGRAYANSPGGGSGSASSEPSSGTEATELLVQVDHVLGNVTLYEVSVEPAPSENVSLGVVVTP